MLRQRYRRAALLVASGEAASSVAADLGWSLSFTESLITDDPAFANLVAFLRTTIPLGEHTAESKS